ncbi:putative neurobeachin/beige protein [Trypanosoma theileri]|uniref:Putative neurobeachin/beige protein n=1 Tax=Trypanosoma theileri TaxID=67003 RepID=A0A1X0NSZ1_9TRYP|nr:putative neurobeachin/beige protein [Trypanosoma theileri]ORC87230.1 putative neurobeachin/beige protein [Trypanosoma theileri]
MPALSERDLSSVQKLFNAMQAALKLTEGRRSNAEVVAAEEQRVWAETANVFWRIAGRQQLHLLSFLAADAAAALTRLCDGLLDYIHARFAALGGSPAPGALLRCAVALEVDHVLHLLEAFCSRRDCAAMLGGDANRDGPRLHGHVVTALVRGQHFTWMTRVFAAACDEARRAADAKTPIATAAVTTATAVLRALGRLLLLDQHNKATVNSNNNNNSSNSNTTITTTTTTIMTTTTTTVTAVGMDASISTAAIALVRAEPRPPAAALLHGLRLRLAAGAPIRPIRRDSSSDSGSSTAATSAENKMPTTMANRAALAQYLAAGRTNIYDMLNREALTIAVAAVEWAAAYDSPEVVTALCLIIDLSSRAVTATEPQQQQEKEKEHSKESKDKPKVPLSLQIAMYENVLLAWDALCKLLRSNIEGESSAEITLHRETILQQFLKNDLVNCVRRMMQHCTSIIDCETIFFRKLITLCTPPQCSSSSSNNKAALTSFAENSANRTIGGSDAPNSSICTPLGTKSPLLSSGLSMTRPPTMETNVQPSFSNSTAHSNKSLWLSFWPGASRSSATHPPVPPSSTSHSVTATPTATVPVINAVVRSTNVEDDVYSPLPRVLSDSVVIDLDTPTTTLEMDGMWWYNNELYIKLVHGLVQVLCDVFTDNTMPLSLRLSTCVTLVRITMHSNIAFSKLEGRIVVRLFLNFLREQEKRLRLRSIASSEIPLSDKEEFLQTVSDTSITPSNEDSTHDCTEDDIMYAALANQIISALWRVYHELNEPPLSSEVVDLVELPLLMLLWEKYGYIGDSILSGEEVKRSLKSLFAPVVQLWYTALECFDDEDINIRSHEVLMELLTKLLSMGVMPVTEMRLLDTDDGTPLTASVNAMATNYISTNKTMNTTNVNINTAAPNSFCGSGVGGVVCMDSVLAMESDNESSLSLKLEAPHVEMGDTVNALSNIFTALLERNIHFLSVQMLEKLFALLWASDVRLSKLGRKYIASSLEFSEVYALYAEVIQNGEVSLLIQLLQLFSAELSSNKLTSEAKHERRVWLFQYGFINAVISVLERVLLTPHQVNGFPRLIQQIFRFLSVFESAQGQGPQLLDTRLIEVFSERIVSVEGAEYFILIAQAVLDAATCKYDNIRSHSRRLQKYGHFGIPLPNCSVEKPVFINLIPSLLRHASEHAADLENNLLAVTHMMLKTTTKVHSDLLLQWVLETKQTLLLPYLEVDAAFVNKQLPYLGKKEEVEPFWAPILKEAPERSELRFNSTGGIIITMGEWPEKGFSISAYFRFEEIYSNMCLFEFIETDVVTTPSPASINVVGGDSVQVLYDGKKIPVNESQALQDLTPRRWVQVLVVMSVARTVSVYLNANKIGTCTLPYFRPHSEVSIHIGFVDTIVYDALFSIGDVILWDDELTTPQVEASLAMTRYQPNICKMLVQEVPRELSEIHNVVEPITDRIAIFTPYENRDMMLLNTQQIAQERYPVIAKLTGNYATPPKNWIDYRMLFLSRGGLSHLLDWIGQSTTEEELRQYTSITCNCIRNITNNSTMNNRTYILLNFHLRRLAHLITPAVCDSLLYLTTRQIHIDDGTHPFIINRLAFDYILRDVELLAMMPISCALYITERIEKLFTVLSCRYAKRNANYIIPFRFVDSVLNSLVYGGISIPFMLRSRLISCVKQVMIACDFEPNIINAVASTAAILTPAEIPVGMKSQQSQQLQQLKSPSHPLVLPRARFSQVRVSLRSACDVTLMILRSLLECSSNGSSVFMTAFARIIDLNWFAVCVSRFADDSCVVYATRLFFEAIHYNVDLRSEVLQCPAAVVAVLSSHCRNEDLMLLLLALSIGADKHIDVLSSKQSLLEQLDGILNSIIPELDAIVAPIFSKLLTLHLNATLITPSCFKPFGITSVMQRCKYYSYRLYKYFSLARVCSRLMLHINIKRLLKEKTQMGITFHKEEGEEITLSSTSSSPYHHHHNDSHHPSSMCSHWHKPVFSLLRVCIILYRGIQRKRYRKLLLHFSNHTAEPLAMETEVRGTFFVLRTLQQLSCNPSLFVSLTLSPYQISALAVFGTFLKRHVVAAKSAELQDAVSSEVRKVEKREESNTMSGSGSGVKGISKSTGEGSPIKGEKDKEKEKEEEEEEEGQQQRLKLRTSKEESTAREEKESSTTPLDVSEDGNDPLESTGYGKKSSISDDEDEDEEDSNNNNVNIGEDARDECEESEHGDDNISDVTEPLANTVGLLDVSADSEEQQKIREQLAAKLTLASMEELDITASSVSEALGSCAVEVLRSTIIASLHTLPVTSGWVGGQTYGSCGGMLFQLMLVMGITSTTEEGTFTLTQFFIQQVLQCLEMHDQSLHAPKYIVTGKEMMSGGGGGNSNTNTSNMNTTTTTTNNNNNTNNMHMSSDYPYSYYQPQQQQQQQHHHHYYDHSTLTHDTSSLDVFFFNVCRFNDLLVDLLSFNVLELSNLSPYFISLLTRAPSLWPRRSLQQLRSQVVKSCIAVLNKPSVQGITADQMELVYMLLSCVLSPEWIMKDMLECLLRVLFRVYASIPPSSMNEEEISRRKYTVIMSLRLMIRTYRGTRELRKALSARTLTQRFSLYDEFTISLLVHNETIAVNTFDSFCRDNMTTVDTLMSGRPKTKADLALKSLLKERSEYINRIKIFNEAYTKTTEIPEKYQNSELIRSYMAQFSSQVGHISPLQQSQLHWLSIQCCSFENKDSSVRLLYYLDTRGNYTKVTSAKSSGETEVNVFSADTCEQQLNHISALVQPFAIRCRPFLLHDRVTFVDRRCTLTNSAVSLLRYLLEPNEVLRFISNGFRINGIHATPCLIILTNIALKLIGFSHITEAGDIFLCNCGQGEEEELSYAFGTNMIQQAKRKRLPQHQTAYSFAISMRNKLQRFLTDVSSDKKKREKEERKDGTKVAQSVRQATGHSCRDLFWVYPLRNVRSVRMAYYMHQDTAILLEFMYDDGLLLSIVDTQQSMNTRARDVFLNMLKEVLGTQRCEFREHSQRSATLRSMLIRWATGSLSTFDYIRMLNRVAGRTRLDYNQYPVYPWILADYKSTELALDSPASYRDLSLPMGAQTETRRQAVSRVYEQMVEMRDADENVKDHQPFHHGTHYSTSGGVLHYLIRVEPYTTFARIFQGGEFDVATRLFDSIEASFQSCVNGPADCKELTPEFFFDGMFLVNVNHCDFGERSDGSIVNDVKLPPWAKGSTQVFTAIMRYTLESRAVVSNIHRWIDLIFGVRRRGKLALERYNVFQCMTYGEEVLRALKESHNPHDIDVIIAEVDNFGQTPTQLFQERHPAQQELEPADASRRSSLAGLGILSGSNFGSIAGGSLTISTVGSNSSITGFGSNSSITGFGNNSIGTTNTNITTTTTTAGVGGATNTTTTANNNNNTNSNSNNTGGSSGVRAGYTYTNAFHEQSPKVCSMLFHALDSPNAWYSLDDPAPGTFQTPPAYLADIFHLHEMAVVDFVTMRGGAKMSCYKYFTPVDDTEEIICWNSGENLLMRFDLNDGRFLSTLRFKLAMNAPVSVSMIRASCRESLILIGSNSGTISCLSPNADNDLVLLSATLCHHENPIAGFALDTHYGRVISFTTSGTDFPIVWCIQRLSTVKLHRLDISRVLPNATVGDRIVVAAAIDPRTAHSIIITRRHLIIFDQHGEPYGVGSLPTADDNIPHLEDEAGQVGVAVDTALRFVASMTAVTTYDTLEWSAGVLLLITGHQDGSLSLWRAVRLPPEKVQHGRVVLIEHHSVIVRGGENPRCGAVTAIRQQERDVPVFLVGYHSGGVKVLSFENRGTETTKTSKT